MRVAARPGAGVAVFSVATLWGTRGSRPLCGARTAWTPPCHGADSAPPGATGHARGDRTRSGRPCTLAAPPAPVSGRQAGRPELSFLAELSRSCFSEIETGVLAACPQPYTLGPPPPPSPAVPILSPLCACPHTGTRAGVLTADVLTGAGVRGDVLEDFPSKDLSLNSLALVTR